jgi:hypothetical protein
LIASRHVGRTTEENTHPRAAPLAECRHRLDEVWPPLERAAATAEQSAEALESPPVFPSDAADPSPGRPLLDEVGQRLRLKICRPEEQRANETTIVFGEADAKMDFLWSIARMR